MADEPTVDFSSVTGFADALAKSPGAFIPFATDAMTVSCRLIQGGLVEYPPETEANQPGRFNRITHEPMGYYERGKGYWHPIMRATTVLALATMMGGRYGKGAGRGIYPVRGAKSGDVVGYRLGKAKSEQLGKSWATSVQASDVGVTGEVGTNTSYAPYVQGAETQSSVLSKYGWDAHTMESVVDELMPQLEEIWSQAADEFIKELA